jgi:hypothetical protein
MFLHHFSPFHHIITNSSLVDRVADTCLTPARYISSVFFDQKIRVFTYISPTEFQENSFLSPIDSTLLKIIQFIRAILLVVPGTLLGLALKKLAAYDESVLTKRKEITENGPLCPPTHLITEELERSLKPLESDSLSLVRLGAVNESDHATIQTVFFNQVLLFLSPQDILNLGRVCKPLWREIHSAAYQNIVSLYQQKLNGMRSSENIKALGLYRIEKLENFHQLAYATTKYAQKYGYSEKLASCFGGLQHLLALPLKGLKLQAHSSVCKTIEDYRHSDAFKNEPSIFRLRIKNENGLSSEVMIIKYTLFVPKEAKLQENDFVWHDYMSIQRNNSKHQLVNRIVDARLSCELDISSQRASLGRPSFPDQFHYTSVIESDLLTETKLKNLILGHPIKYIPQRGFSPPDYLNTNPNAQEFKGKRLFEHVPVVLGHVNLGEIQTLFNHRKPADFITNAQGAIIKGPERRPGDYELYTLKEEKLGL